jgi:cytochrome c oxidase assembly protein subunit 15
MSRSDYSPWLHRYAVFVAFATFLLIVAGALVTSNDAGLSVPSWPTFFGSFRMPRMVGGVFYEAGHRMVAGVVVVLTLVLAAWIWRIEKRRWVRRLAALSVLAIVIQAVLGGITVLYFLPVPVSVAHACMAQVFFCIMVSLAIFTGRDWRWDETKIEDHSSPTLRWLAMVNTSLIFVLILLGAIFRHHGFGVIPHIIVALLVTAGTLWILTRVLSQFRQSAPLVRAALLLTGLLALQLLLGVGSYIELLTHQSAPQPEAPVVDITTAHVAVGGLVLVASLWLAYRIYRYVGPPSENRATPLQASAHGKVTA